MGWKGTMRSVSALARQMEKDAQRRQKQALKEQISDDAAEEVRNWENHIEGLLTVHTDLVDPIDWQKLLAKPRPEEPEVLSHHQDKAETALSDFKPSIFDFFRGGTAKRQQILADTFSQAPTLDLLDHQKAMTTFNNELSDWETDRSLAKRLNDGDCSAIQEVIAEMQNLPKNDLIGTAVKFSIGDNWVHARPQIHENDIIPNYRLKQLASGKLSETKMPVSQFNELYQDYVASVALKVAGDLFQILPLSEVFVTCESNMLNSATGYKEPTPVLSVQFVRETMMQLNLAGIDPSESMLNFNHTMKFSRTKGFSPVHPLKGDSE